MNTSPRFSKKTGYSAAVVDVIWLQLNPEAPARGYWDQGMLEDLLNGRMWGRARFKHWEALQSTGGKRRIPALDGAVVVFPARQQVDYVEQLNRELAKLKWVILILTGDEDNSFPVERIKHSNIRIWVMSPRPDRHGEDIRKIGSGYPPQARGLLRERFDPNRPVDWSFAGQITHSRRQECAWHMGQMLQRAGLENGRVVPTESFTAGLSHEKYYALLAMSRVVICPSGPETPDTFRVFEALEAGCVPLVDGMSPRTDWNPEWQWWTYLFDEEPPFPVFTIYDQLTGYTEAAVQGWPEWNNRIFSWWIGYKRKLYNQLIDDVCTVSESPALNKLTPSSYITVLIPTSPIPSHPSTEIIEQTIRDVRVQLPDAEIIVMCDGVRDEQVSQRLHYERYKHRLIWLCNYEWKNVLPVIYDEHLHQAEMTRRSLDLVKTPLVLFVEHDTPLCPDFDFEWSKQIEAVMSGEANVIRYYHEAQIVPDHEHLMLSEPEMVSGIRMRKTAQWSQRPHLASAVFYRWLLETHIHPDSRTMIEDALHGVVQDDCAKGLLGWYLWRLWLYTPEGDNIKRSTHSDGRAGESKYDMRIVPVR